MPGICESANGLGASVWPSVSANRLRARIWSFESDSGISIIFGLLSANILRATIWSSESAYRISAISGLFRVPAG